MLSIIQTIAPVFVLILAGAAIQRLGGLPAAAGPILNTFVYRLALPLLLLASIAQAPAAQILQPGFAAAVTLGTLLPGAAVAILFRRQHPGPRAVFLGFTATFSNAAFVGLPVLQLLFPGRPEAVLAMGIYALLGLPFVLTAVFALERERHPQAAWGLLAGTLARNPLLLGSLAGLVLALTGLSLPAWLDTACRMVGGTASPLALLAIGMRLAETAAAPAPTGPRLEHALLAATKLGLQPLITFALLAMVGVGPLWRAMGTMLAAMPIGTMAAVLAEAYGVLAPTVATAILVTTILSSLTLPAAFALLQGL